LEHLFIELNQGRFKMDVKSSINNPRIIQALLSKFLFKISGLDKEDKAKNRYEKLYKGEK
jgi:hypothetical protein